MSDSIERLSFELSTRALAEQERMLAGMRATAGTLIAAASVAASLRTPSTAHVSLGGVIALVACTLSVACAVWVLLPHALAFAVHGDDLRLVDHQARSGGAARALEQVRTCPHCAVAVIRLRLPADRDRLADPRFCLVAYGLCPQTTRNSRRRVGGTRIGRTGCRRFRPRLPSAKNSQLRNARCSGSADISAAEWRGVPPRPDGMPLSARCA